LIRSAVLAVKWVVRDENRRIPDYFPGSREFRVPGRSRLHGMTVSLL
jgi:hypothetical protein